MNAKEWIKVEDDLPKDSGTVIFYAPKRWVSISIGYYAILNEYWQDITVDRKVSHEVTHWMPLPEPPSAAFGKEGE